VLKLFILQIKVVMYVLSKTRRVCSNCHGVFNFFRLVKILVEYLAIFVVYLANPFLSS